MLDLTDKELIAAAASVLLPALIALVQRPTWSSRARALVAYGVVFVWTVFALFFTNEQGPLAGWRDWARLLLACGVVAFTTYLTFWKATGLAQRIEAMTSPPSRARAALAWEADVKARPPRDEED